MRKVHNTLKWTENDRKTSIQNYYKKKTKIFFLVNEGINLKTTVNQRKTVTH